ncbi:MAG: HlyC/CorC family transporter [Proteobacteria bacterium]|nr:HlyC/CorC family transporter [Pseudomonadota bacterium]
MTMGLLLVGGGIFLLLVLSAFFSGSETALTSVSRPRLHHLERRGNRRAGLVNRLIGDRERLIGAILLGNNAVNIFASALATSVLIGLFGEAGIAYATIGMTLLVLIFAEVLPKTYALRHADRVALAVAPIMRLMVIVLSPITRTIQAVVRVTLRLLGAAASADDHGLSAEQELRGAIELHTRKGAMVKQERDMLGSILDLEDVEVSEIMVHRKGMTVIDAEEPPSRIIERVIASPYTRIPLWRGDPDNIIGVLHSKDLLTLVHGHDGPIDKLDLAATALAPWFIPDSTTLLRQLQAFRHRRAHFALVVDEYGALMGLVTLEDILEEIVGDIADEHDIAFTGVRINADGSYTVRGTVTVRDLNREFEWDLPDEAASTIAGLVIHEAQRIPEMGQSFAFYGFKFEVLTRQRNQITSLRLTPPAAESADEEPA